MSLFTFWNKGTTDEEQMLKKVRDGDKAAIEWLYRHHVRYLTALCSRYITNDEDIRDVLQDAFIKIYNSLDSFTFRGKGSLKAWMARITLNETLSFIRKNTHFDTVDIDNHDVDTTEEDVETDGITDEMLHQFIQELPDGYRTVFNLYVIEEKSHKEIAQTLGIKVNTSASQLHKAKAMLAKRIKQYRTTNPT